MSLDMTGLLIHDEHVPLPARRALREAHAAGADERAAKLESAARILYAETDLECEDVRELIGLPAEGDCTCEGDHP